MSRPAPAGAIPRARWPYAGAGQPLLLVGSLLALVGSLLPWVQTAVGTFNGLSGGGLYTFAVAWIGIAGAVLRSRQVVLAHALVAGVVCVGLPAWQLVHLWSLRLGGGWLPGVGLGLVALGGLLCLRGAWRLWRGPG